jgi:hypothetical protein
MSQVVVSAKVHFERGRRASKEIRPGERKQCDAPSRLHRITKLMALAIRFERLVLEGAVRDYADLARLGRVSRARITQVMALLQLAPDIQEALLFLPRVTAGKDPLTERELRPIAATADWKKQRMMWERIRPGGATLVLPSNSVR